VATEELDESDKHPGDKFESYDECMNKAEECKKELAELQQHLGVGTEKNLYQGVAFVVLNKQ
jgi:hypothetical protein